MHTHTLESRCEVNFFLDKTTQRKNIKQHFVIGVFFFLFLRTHQLHTEQQFTYIDTDQSENERERMKERQ